MKKINLKCDCDLFEIDSDLFEIDSGLFRALQILNASLKNTRATVTK